MKKRFFALLSVVLCLILVAFAGCGPVKVQGLVIDKNDKTTGTLYVGNTTATSGDYAAVGVPFNYGINAYLHQYNEAGGYVQGDVTYKVELKTYDDGFDATTGVSYTQKLVEKDKVFAMLGHFGTGTVDATLDYLEEKGIPMFYAATGISDLYNASATGNQKRIMPVQPIYEGEGSALLATAFAPSPNGLNGTKIGVIYTDDDAGMGLKQGIQAEATKLNKDDNVVYQQVGIAATDANAQATAIKAANCDVVILAANLLSVMGEALKAANYTGKMLTSYVNSNSAVMGRLAQQGVITEQREMYATGWLNLVDTEGYLGYSADYWDFVNCLNAYEQALQNKEGDATVASLYGANAYAMAGYIAANMFCQVLERVEQADVELTYDSFVEYAEQSNVKIPMGESIDFSNGQRTGVTSLCLSSYTYQYTTEGEGDSAYFNSAATLVRGLMSLPQLEALLSPTQQ